MTDYSKTLKLNAKNNISEEIRTEFIRKSIHVLIALVPSMAQISLNLTYFLLLSGVVVFSCAEFIRMQGGSVVIISRLTLLASRKRDSGRFVLGPVTLAIGALLALSIYPAPAAAIAIYALAFGDSFSSIIGKMFGKIKIPFTDGKTLAGSIACFSVVFAVSYLYTLDLNAALIIGSSAAILEAIPAKDLDNVIIPLGTGAIASLFF